ncbi:MAG: hypothetical protein EPO07_15950 [Verrucomicrobia bacterium]|nr:MAG: hypothetical protein EPO07_15950 [Verrucomicrobiota bacterium]
MSEIKFACPTCNQHIACEVTYADMVIVCPSCGGTMVVPILSEACAAHPNLVLVASLPVPKQKFRSRVPTLEPWTEKDWVKHYTTITGERPDTSSDRVLRLLILIVSLPVIGLGVLFIGCTAGCR